MSFYDEAKDVERKIMKQVPNNGKNPPPENTHLSESAANLAHSVKTLSEDGAHRAADYMRETLSDLKASGTEALQKTEARIQEKPGQSIAIAFAAGVLASLLFGRRMS